MPHQAPDHETALELLRTRLADPRPLLLDGATGSELTRRGVDTGLPLWSAKALVDPAGHQVLKEIHLDYLAAGAQVITTNTFRTHRRSLDTAGMGHRAAELTHLAVRLAREAIAEFMAARTDEDPRQRPLVAGSLAPLMDCYCPELVPAAAECATEHDQMAANLAQAGVDFILVETMNTVREAVAAAQAARAKGLPFAVSFVCGKEGRLLSGETVTRAARALLDLQPALLGINCTAMTTLHRPLAELRAACGSDLPLSAYANLGHPDDRQGWAADQTTSPAAYARRALGWVELGAKLVGGCCGTRPAHIQALDEALGKSG